jgi:hypothetical protein
MTGSRIWPVRCLSFCLILGIIESPLLLVDGLLIAYDSHEKSLRSARPRAGHERACKIKTSPEELPNHHNA